MSEHIQTTESSPTHPQIIDRQAQFEAVANPCSPQNSQQRDYPSLRRLFFTAAFRPTRAASLAHNYPHKHLILFAFLLTLFAPYLIFWATTLPSFLNSDQSILTYLADSHYTFYIRFLREGYDEIGIPGLFPIITLLSTAAIHLLLCLLFASAVAKPHQSLFSAISHALKRLVLLYPVILLTILTTATILTSYSAYRSAYWQAYTPSTASSTIRRTKRIKI
ncbi:hypothetical protein KS4_19850 [Poriferisphaera corsica]|uniref:Uncharacterized protein n=1 Tax=Poriferisphaera corsica TaxID=2528020 RepID=A0A517YUN6_9BACT|nr:hypothetical protein [Poriferisphaera corsica]QDU33925.1 hypothetical protein KS4_19850 [Poriferisphaera corsica]